MNKKSFKTGDIITPEFLNALQNMSFDKSIDEVGHLPLPPEHSEMNQLRTFSGYGSAISIDLGEWTRNTVVLHKTAASTHGTFYPKECSISGYADDGFLLYMPIGTVSDVILTYCGNSYTCHNGSALLVITEYIGLAHSLWSKVFEIPLQGAEAFFEAIKTSGNISVEGDIDCNGKITGQNGSFEEEVSGKRLVGKSIKIQQTNGLASFDVNVDTDGVVTFVVRGNTTYDAQTFSFNSNTGFMRIGHSYTDVAETIEMQNGRLVSEKHAGVSLGGWTQKIAIHGDFDIEGNILDSKGCISVFSSSTSTQGTETRKITITPYGITFYKANDNLDGWDTLNSLLPNT